MNIERIEEMEKNLDECNEAVRDMQAQVERMREIRERMTALFRYYGSEAWYEDREGELPEGVKAGVLSEDSVYDAITAVREAAFGMLEQGTDILKNRI